MERYLYEIHVVDKEYERVKDFDVIADSIDQALFKGNDLIRREIDEGDFETEMGPYRIIEIKEDRSIDA